LNAVKAAQELKKKLKRSVHKVEKHREDRVVVELARERIRDAVKVLDRFGARLATVSAVDLGVDLELLYHMSLGGAFLNLRVTVPKEDLAVDSITPLVAGASWIEREIKDLFGVEFRGHPDPRNLLLPFEWKAEDTPLKGGMRGLANPYQKPGVESLLKSGLMFPISGLTSRRRSKLNLSEQPDNTATRPESLKELQKLAKKVKFDKKMGYDWDKKKVRY
jgi:NADH-quinone oxidoreductase subunit C